jgi:5-methylcytosine-specific restriction endonuclease McrA
VQQKFVASIHGQGIARGNGLAPVCTDCRGIHSILSHKNPTSPVAQQNVSRDTCASCHEGVRLSKQFGLPGDRVSSYMDSYHGLATQAGSVVAANCSSCHGVHDILPSSDPHSSINRANLDATCGKCHKGVTQTFTLTRVHTQDGAQTRDVGSIATRWVRLIYIPLIILVIGAMALHSLIIWRRKMADRRRSHTLAWCACPPISAGSISFCSAASSFLSSLALLSSTWFAHLLSISEWLRSIVHRVAGVILIATGIYHVFYIAAAREGRKLLPDLAPAPRDAFDALHAMLYYLGLRKDKPQFARFNYAEKAEYGHWCGAQSSWV